MRITNGINGIVNDRPVRWKGRVGDGVCYCCWMSHGVFFFFLIISLVGHFLGEGGGLFICKVFSSVALFLL